MTTLPTMDGQGPEPGQVVGVGGRAATPPTALFNLDYLTTWPIRCYFLPGQPSRVQILSVLGEGSFGAVYLMYDSMMGRHSAVKQIHHMSENGPSLLRAEVETLHIVTQSGPHPNLASQYGYFWAPIIRQTSMEPNHHDMASVHVPGLAEPLRPTIELEYIPGVNLDIWTSTRWAVLDEPPSTAVWSITQGLLSALTHLHTIGVAHRDIKPANVMLKFPELPTPVPVLFDFGLACVTADRYRHLPYHCSRVTFAGTIENMSPQLARIGLKGVANDPRPEVILKNDVWALGTVLYYVATGTSWIDERVEEEKQVMAMIARNPAPVAGTYYPHDPNVSRLISKLMTKSCRMRPSAGRALQWCNDMILLHNSSRTTSGAHCCSSA